MPLIPSMTDDRRGGRRRHRRRERHRLARRPTSPAPSAPFRVRRSSPAATPTSPIGVTGADGAALRAAPAAARPRARQRPRHGPRAPHHRRPAGRPPCRCRRSLGYCDDRRSTARRSTSWASSTASSSATATSAEAVARPRRPGRTASRSIVDTLAAIHAVDLDAVGLADLGRHEGYIARQLKRWYGQWNQQKTRELPARRRGPRRAARRGSPSRARRRSSTATTASTTAWSTTTATSSPCSTGRSARSATRSPTSGCCWSTGPAPTTTPSAWAGRPRPRRASGTGAELAERYAEVSGRDVSSTRLLRRVRLLEAGLHPRGRVRPLPRRRARRARPGRARAVQAAGRRAPRRRRRATLERLPMTDARTSCSVERADAATSRCSS